MLFALGEFETFFYLTSYFTNFYNFNNDNLFLGILKKEILI